MILMNDFSNAVFVRFIWHLALLNDSCYEDVGDFEMEVGLR